MNETLPLKQVIKEICEKDKRYNYQAYLFVKNAFDYTFSELKKEGSIPSCEAHISGETLLDGIRRYALDQYGPMAKTLMDTWGVKKCKDFGHIVFNLIEYEVLGKSENDSLNDFNGGYSFEDAFVKPYLPTKKVTN